MGCFECKMSLPRSIELPEHYGKLQYNTIKLNHVPETSPDPTPVIVLTLYRPKNYNAFTIEMMAELEEVFNIFAVDNRVKGIVVTGHGKMFCAGADLDVGFTGGKERSVDHKDGLVYIAHRDMISIFDTWKPSMFLDPLFPGD